MQLRRICYAASSGPVAATATSLTDIHRVPAVSSWDTRHAVYLPDDIPDADLPDDNIMNAPPPIPINPIWNHKESENEEQELAFRLLKTSATGSFKLD